MCVEVECEIFSCVNEIANMATARNFLVVCIKFNVVRVVHNIDHIMEE